MAGNADVIKEFLVSLGWKIDEKGQKGFTDALASATVKAVALGTAIEGAATAVVAGVAKIADQMEALYFASKRTDASVANIQAMGFAYGQMGSSAAAAQASLENLARFMRNSPGAEGLLKGIGVQTRDVNGGLRDTTEIMGDLGRQFARMPYYRANAYAQALGIDERSLMAMREGVAGFSDEYRAMLRVAGIDSQEAAKQSHLFMNELRTLGSAFVILGQKIASSLAGSLSGNLRRFREGVVDNFQRVSEIVASVVKGILFLADVISTLSFRAMQVIGGIVDWFNSLDDGTKKVIIGIGLLTAAWKLLNSAFAASPVGRIVMLGTALLSLYDDYKVWKEGGKSLIDWSRWLPDIELAQRLLKRIGEQFTELGEIISAVSERRWGDLAKHAKQFAKLAVDGWKDIYSTIRSQLGGELPKLNTPVGEQPAHPYSLFQSGTPQATAPAAAMPATADPHAPRGIRNNNPGNLNYVGQAGAAREAGPNGRFAVFRTAEEGLAALANQLRLYARRGIRTIRDIIGKFAPSGENNTQAYIASVSRSLGVSATSSIDVNDPRVMQGLMNAIIRVENGRNPYSAEQLAAASGTAATSAAGRSVVIHQTNSTVVHGASDPRATGQAVANAQDGVNQRLIRNMRSPAQ